jgi:hypothetical protein
LAGLLRFDKVVDRATYATQKEAATERGTAGQETVAERGRMCELLSREEDAELTLSRPPRSPNVVEPRRERRRKPDEPGDARAAKKEGAG